MNGKELRLQRIFALDGRAFILPIDEPLIAGPASNLRERSAVARFAAGTGATAVLGYVGSLGAANESGVQLTRITHLTVSTRLGSHTDKRRYGTVQHAVAAGADAVAVQVHFSDQREPEMLTNLGDTVAEADSLGIPVLAIAYPRRATATPLQDDNYLTLRDSEPEKYAALVAHCARAAADMGAAFIKVPYTGSIETFRSVLDACSPTPVVVAGGPYLSDEATLLLAEEALRAGAAGLSIGRGLTESSAAPQLGARLRRMVLAG